MKVRVELEIEVKGDATFDEVEEYLKFETCFYGCCGYSNPFQGAEYTELKMLADIFKK